MTSYTMTTTETATWDGDDDSARDELRRDIRDRVSPLGAEVYTEDGTALYVIDADSDGGA